MSFKYFREDVRNGVMRVVFRRGGIATLRQIADGLTADGIQHYHDGLVYYVLQLRKDEALHQIGHALYCTPEYLSDEGAGIFLRLPYGMRSKGWALYYMLTHHVVGPNEVHEFLVKRGVVTSKRTTYTTLCQLYAAGYVDKRDRGQFMLSAKLYETIGITSPICNEAPTHVSNAQLRSLVVPILRERGPTSVPDMRKILEQDGIIVTRIRLRTAMHSLILTKKAKVIPTGKFTLLETSA